MLAPIGSIHRRFVFSLLTVFALLSVSAAQAQFTTTANSDGSLNISAYTESGGIVTIPSTINGVPVTSIGNYAFENCYGLTGITIPNSVISIGVDAFLGCSRLTSLTIGNSVTSIGDSAFYECSSLTTVTIPNSVISIGFIAFSECKSLNSLTIGNSVTSIGDSAFVDCSSLTSVTIPNSVISIADDAFEGCSSLTAINVNTSNPAYSSAAGVLFNQNQTTLVEYPAGLSGIYTIPTSVTSIGIYAFSGCAHLTGVTIPTSVTSIGVEAFQDCSGLTNVMIPNSVTSIGLGAFGSCTSLTSVTIPNSVTSIALGAFQNCTSLTSVTIPNSVTSIGSFAFDECGNLTAIMVNPGNSAYSSVAGVLFNLSQTALIQYPARKVGTAYTIPTTVTNIGDGAFDSCTSLTSVTIPASVTSIGESAFSVCSSLTSVTIPESVTSIGLGAFWNCDNLTNVYFTGNAPTADSTVFSADTKLTVYYLPGASGWGSTFAGVPAVMSSPPAIAMQPSGEAVVTGASAGFTVAARGTPAPTYQWQVSMDAGNTWNNVSGSAYAGITSATLTIIDPATNLLAYEYRAVITNIAGSINTTPVLLVVGSSAAKLAWLQNNFNTGQLSNLSIVADTATPANDGISNLIKYAFNLNPFADSNASLPIPQIVNGQLTLTFQALQSDLTYTVQGSTDLMNWSTTGVTFQTSGPQVRASYAIPVGNAAFMRIVVTPGQ